MFDTLSSQARLRIILGAVVLATIPCYFAGCVVLRNYPGNQPDVVVTDPSEIADASVPADQSSSVPVPGTPDLAANSDTGVSNTDNITTDRTPQFTGICTNDMKIYLTSNMDGELNHPETVCAGGNYDITINSELTEASHSISATAIDGEGNRSAPSSPLNLVVDITSPVPPGIPDLAAASDTGNSNTDNITSDNTPQFTGTCTDGDTIIIVSSVNGDQLPSGVCAGGRYDITLTSNLSEVTHAISAKAIDPAGNSNISSSLLVTVETLSSSAPGTPDLADGSDSGRSSTDNITRVTSPQFYGVCSDGDIITINSSSDGNLSPTAVCAAGQYNITLTSVLSSAVHSITANALKNTGEQSASLGLIVEVDTSPPSAPSPPDLEAGSDTGGSQSDNLTADATPRLTGTCTEGDIITINSSIDGAQAQTAICTGGNYDLTLPTNLSQGSHDLSATETDVAGNVSAPSGATSVIIDNTAPAAPGVPDLSPGSDTGVSNSDNITADTTPQFTGVCAEGDRIALHSSRDGNLDPTVTCTGGQYDITVSNTLTDGTHTITARATDPAGNTSIPSGGLNVTVDTSAPGVPGVPDLASGSDTGSSNSDNITKVVSPRFTGTCETGERINLTSNLDGALNPADSPCSGNAYDITITSTLSQGTHIITAKATDSQNTISSDSGGLSVTVDTTAPAAPGTPDLSAGSDTGSSNSDNITSDKTPQFTGTCESNSTVTLSSSASGTLSPSVNCASGVYDIIVTSALSEGDHDITATQTDPAGNVSPVSAFLEVDVVIPTLAVGLVSNIGSDAVSTSGGTPSDGQINCPTVRCDTDYALDDVVTLNVNVDATSSFQGWGGDCASLGNSLSGNITLNGDKNCTATFTAALLPEIDVEGNGVSISDGDASPDSGDHTDFGTITVGGSQDRTFSIQNEGTGTLNLTDYPNAVTLSGAAEFAVQAQPIVGLIPAGGADLVFVVRCTPTSAGTISTTVSIANDDLDESSYDFLVSCTGAAAPEPEIDVEGNGVSIADGDNSPDAGDFTNFGNVSIGGSVDRTFFIQNEGANTLSLTDFPNAVTLSGSGDFSIQAQPVSDAIVAGGGDLSFVVRCTPSAAGTVNTTVSIANNDADENPYDFLVSCTGEVATAPEIDVEGNAVSIADGDATPDAGDHTDFGNVSVGGSVDRTFTIQNEGTDTLSLTDFPNAVTLSGSGDFSVQAQPAADSIAAGGGDLTFVVRCAPSAVGAISTTVSIANNDSDENPYDFVLSCNGEVATAPEIDVEGNAISIADGDATPDAGDHTDFGNVSVGGSLDRTFTIQNEGTDTLSLTDFPNAVTLSGSGDFSIQAQPAADNIAAGGGDLSFVVRCTPSAAGAISTTVSIANNDADENPYDFVLSCTGEVATAPEIDVEGNAVSIADGDATPDAGDHTDFGVVPVGGSLDRTFSIQNEGTDTLSLTDFPNVVTLTGAGEFSIQAQPTADSIAAGGGDQTFVVRCTPSGAAAFTTTVSIASNDADETPYDFVLSCTGAVISAPEMDVQRPLAASIADGDTNNLGDHSTGAANLLYVIDNTAGSDTLSLSGVTTENLSNVSAFTLNTAMPLDIPAGDTATIEVSFNVDGGGPFNLDMDIANNDSDENPYDIHIEGNGAAVAEIDIYGNDQLIFSGDTTPDLADHTDFGSADINGAWVTRNYVIKNTGTGDLSLAGVSISGANDGDFSVVRDATSTVAAGEEFSFTIGFDPSELGLREATISVASNDADESTYTFDVQGTGTDVPAPEMDVLGNGVSIPSGDTTPHTDDTTDFGDVDVATGLQAYMFTIQNSGTADLNLSGAPIVTIGGTHAADFILSLDAATPVALGGGTATFEVTFDPNDAGLREATVTIANDDSDENPYTFSIQGTGTN